MTTKLLLDASAIRTLFPEGTEAHAKLQQCVIAEFARKTFPKYLSEQIRKEVESVICAKISTQNIEGIRLEIEAAIKEYFTARLGVQHLGKARDKIKLEVREMANSEIRHAIHEELHEQMVKMNANIKQEIESLAPVYLKSFASDDLRLRIRNEAMNIVKETMQKAVEEDTNEQ